MAFPEAILGKWGYASAEHLERFNDASRSQYIFKKLFSVNYPVFCAPCFKTARRAGVNRDDWQYANTNALRGLVALLEAA